MSPSVCSASVKVSLSSCADSVSLSSSGTDGSSLRQLVLKVGAIPSPFLHRDFLADLRRPQSRRAAPGGPFLEASASLGSHQVKRQLLEMEAESFVCWSIRDWTRATQVICHLLMELINGCRVEGGGGGSLPTMTRPVLGSSG